jgi:hypothetical protein
MSDNEMRAAFQIGTDEGLMAWLNGVVDTLLFGDVILPQEGDTPEVLALKAKGRAYRDQAVKMLGRLSGLDEIHQRIMAGEPMWSSQNALSAALSRAMSDGIDIAAYAAPRYAEMADDDPRSEEMVAEIAQALEANPVLAKKVRELYGDDDN